MAQTMTRLEAQGLKSYMHLVRYEYQDVLHTLGVFLQRQAFLRRWVAYDVEHGRLFEHEHMNQFDSISTELATSLYSQDPAHPVLWARVEQTLPESLGDNETD